MGLSLCPFTEGAADQLLQPQRCVSFKRHSSVKFQKSKQLRLFFQALSRSTQATFLTQRDPLLLVPPLSHVFICYSSLSLDAASRIAEEIPREIETRLYFFILFDGDPGRTPPDARVFTMSPPPSAYSEWVKPFKIAEWFSGCLESLNSDHIENLVAYIPHPFELPGNHFLFSEPRAIRVELLPDGLINYYNYSLKPETLGKGLRYSVRILLRTFAAKRYGLRYRPLRKGHITQYESGRYTTSWAPTLAGYITRAQTVRLLPPRQGIRSKKQASKESEIRTLLICDQEIRHLVTAPLEAEMRRLLVESAVALKADRIIYKAHPRGKNRAPVLSSAGLAVEDLSGHRLAEELLEEEAVTDLLGFYSTPLVLSGDLVDRRVSIFPGEKSRGVKRPQLVSEIRLALVASGVTLIEPGAR